MLKTKLAVAGLLAAAVFSEVSLAGAQTADKAAAEALFQAARDLMTAGKFAEACPKLEASQRLDAGLGTLLYLADCYEKAGRLASAWATFREAESIAMSRNDQGRATVAQQRAAAVEPRLSKVWFRVATGEGAATEIKLNGRVVSRASWDVAIPVDKGDQEVEAHAEGRRPWKSVVRIATEATSVPIDVPHLEAAPAEVTPAAKEPAGETAAVASPPDASLGGTQRTVGLIVGGVGVVGVVLGGVFGLGAKSKNEDSLDHCPNDPNRCDAKGVSLRDDALRAANAGTLFMIGGGVLVAGGLTLYLTAPSGSPASGGVQGLRIATEGNPGAARVSLKGAF
jgi:serine/threonine-protein kinase